jgi:hypothetical protein
MTESLSVVNFTLPQSDVHVLVKCEFLICSKLIIVLFNAQIWKILTLCRSCLNPYCLGRKTAFFFSRHLNLHAKPETGIPYREKNYNN